MWKFIALLLVAGSVTGGVYLLLGAGQGGTRSQELLNVSYDPTRELWRALNEQFIARYERDSGVRLTINQSHGGSSSQARAVIDGLDADVVTLALWTDTDALRKKGLLAPDWSKRLPNNSLPYHSTIVFVVRKGNPKNIHDWPDLLRPGVEVITPNPKTSGNGKLSFLAAWGSVRHGGGTDKDALDYVKQLYQHTPILDLSARASTVTFAQRHMGDVHLTWENEAHLEVQEARGELEIVFPKSSIRAEPYVAVVDANVRAKGTEKAAEAYLQFLYTEEGQEIIARHYYRPSNERVLARHSASFPEIALFPISYFLSGWDEGQERFFAEGAIFDQVYQPKSR